MQKPLNRKAYGSIGHLPASRLGPGDHRVPDGQAEICTHKPRDKHDIVIVQEKLDGSCTAVAKINAEIVALGRAGWPAISSRWVQHKMFAQWVDRNYELFDDILDEGERIIGEWCAQAHGTLYDFDFAPWFPFDIMMGERRADYLEFLDRLSHIFHIPHHVRTGPTMPAEGMRILEEICYPCDQTEGIVYRVERKGEVDFLAKYVRPDKVDGKYLSEISGEDPVWNWYPDWWK